MLILKTITLVSAAIIFSVSANGQQANSEFMNAVKEEKELRQIEEVRKKEENAKREAVLRENNYKAYVKFLEENPASPFTEEIRGKVNKYIVEKIEKDARYRFRSGSVRVKPLQESMTGGIDDQGASVYRGYFRIGDLEVDGTAHLFNDGLLLIEGGSTLYKYKRR